MPYEKIKPVTPTHQGPILQKQDYRKISTGQNTSQRPTHRGQTKGAKGYKSPQSK